MLFSFPGVTKKPSSPMQNKLCKAETKWRRKKHPLKWDLECTFLQTTCLQLSTWRLVIYEHIGLWRFVTLNTAHQKCMASYSKKTHLCRYLCSTFERKGNNYTPKFSKSTYIIVQWSLYKKWLKVLLLSEMIN